MLTHSIKWCLILLWNEWNAHKKLQPKIFMAHQVQRGARTYFCRDAIGTAIDIFMLTCLYFLNVTRACRKSYYEQLRGKHTDDKLQCWVRVLKKDKKNFNDNSTNKCTRKWSGMTYNTSRFLTALFFYKYHTITGQITLPNEAKNSNTA